MKNFKSNTLSPLNFSRKPPYYIHNFKIFDVLAKTSLNLRCFQVILMIQRCFLGEISFQTSKIMSNPI
ncbi:hypothetical protein Hanom_Chr04g00328531 [Helianthus anomalus]